LESVNLSSFTFRTNKTNLIFINNVINSSYIICYVVTIKIVENSTFRFKIFGKKCNKKNTKDDLWKVIGISKWRLLRFNRLPMGIGKTQKISVSTSLCIAIITRTWDFEDLAVKQMRSSIDASKNYYLCIRT